MRKNDVPIPLPCSVDWQKMTPADKGRFCGDCKKVVRDLSKMSEMEASALVQSAQAAAAGDLCVRFLHDRHGKIFFEEDLALRDGLLPRSFLVRARRTAVAAASLAMPLLSQACSFEPFAAIDSALSSPPTAKDELTQNMGGMALDETQVRADAAPPADPDAAPDAATPPSPPDAGATDDDAAPSDPDSDPDAGPRPS
jgi:hypothetical protein